MKLVRQVQLEFREGNSDKVYEVDLCEVGTDQFVVNFRYGRRESNLRDGTKTGVPVTEIEAVRIFDSLVDSKEAKGYQRFGTDISGEPVSFAEQPGSADPEEPLRQRVLNRLALGNASDNHWKLSRAVWRCGELRLRGAEPFLIPLIGSADAMLDYSIAWSLGQCGSSGSIEPLKLLEAGHDSDTVRRISAVALLEVLEGQAKQQAVDECIRQLPTRLLELAKDNSPSDEFIGGQFEAELQRLLTTGDLKHFELLDVVYLINNEQVRPALLNILATAPLSPNYFQRIRHIFKAAELRRDGEIFGLIARRFETTRSQFRMYPKWYYQRFKIPVPTVGRDAKSAFGGQTRNYLRKRIWRTLRRLGELNQPDYVRLAAGVLRHITDDDGGTAQQDVRYAWNPETRNSIATVQHYDRFASFVAFYRILFGNSHRYEPNASGRRFRCVDPYVPGRPAAGGREDIFPHLWNQQPEVVVDLLTVSRCEWVHQFGVRVLKDCVEFCWQMPTDLLVKLVQSQYQVTVRFAFDLAVERFDPANPDATLVLALAGCSYQPAREQSHQWINEHRTVFCHDAEFVVALMTSPQSETRVFARDVLGQVTFSDVNARVIIGKAIAYLRTLGDADGPVAADATQTLHIVFQPHVRNIGIDVIRDLLAHSLPELNRFAGELLLDHETLSKHPPDDVLRGLLESDHSDVRRVGAQIIGQLPDAVLKESIDLLVGLTRHEMPDIRETIRPTVIRLAESDVAFGERIAGRLIDALLRPGAPDGVPTHTSRVLLAELRSYLSSVSTETVWKLLQSRSAPAQEVGGALLATNVNPNDLAVPEIVRLANHEILSVRESACQMFSDNVQRMRDAAEDSVRIADSRWEDIRQFAFAYIRTHFVDDENGTLSPNILISICDSARPDVQQFGRELITRLFEDGHGEEYVLKLSEHPTGAMQLFASNFLEQHARDRPEQLEQLMPYFVSVLSQVNRGRIAKDRTLRILEREALKNEQAADTAAKILSRVSATTAVMDRAAIVEILLRIEDVFPSVKTPLNRKPVEVRDGV